MHNFTPNDLLLHHFGETNSTLKSDISAALRQDEALALDFENLKEDLLDLKNIRLQPNEKRMQHILKTLHEESGTLV